MLAKIIGWLVLGPGIVVAAGLTAGHFEGGTAGFLVAVLGWSCLAALVDHGLKAAALVARGA